MEEENSGNEMGGKRKIGHRDGEIIVLHKMHGLNPLMALHSSNLADKH